MRRPGGPVVVGPSDPAAAAAFAADLAADAPDLPGIVGGLTACEAFAHEWRVRTGRDPVLRFRLRHHVLTAVAAPPAPASGAARLAVDGDLDWLVAAQKAFAAEAGVLEPSERVAALVPQRLARGFLWIWDDGGAAAFAGWWDASEDVARIAPVYTLPGARRRGYATALVAALAQGLLDRGRRRIFLVTDLANPTSNAIYARVGFRPLAELCHFDFVAPG
jgi:GNAT superfamily N-acetyltransferase